MTSPDGRAVVDQLARAAVALFYPHVEAVLHDTEHDRIIAIWNPQSGREVGEASLLDAALLGRLEPGQVLGPYEQVGRDGRSYSAVSMPLRGTSWLLCLNFDRTTLLDAGAVLAAFAAPSMHAPEALFARDWRAEINQTVRDWCLGRNRPREQLNRAERIDLLAELDGRGLFDTRNAAEHAAGALAISRASVYSLLRQARQARQARQEQGPPNTASPSKPKGSRRGRTT
ncbi:helix-turn-helix domain-containing protein [Jatrophihabitans telluris]|uniref:Helix-turn-helix domain-containing protein n=1 Tax=Jatrophihabitans telluris TaxID=2038343 RepID=A0ABY4QTQ3_9ACTN|nr:helix-turn-helix domain-containing protein [Jatrophihabitans telluris]UQX86905.1 helix-turn-helix domain-containing protein [Jatrophihabitans telluris]